MNMAIDPSGIERLIAAEQIRALKSRYFRFVDTQDWDALASLFCRDAVFDTTRALGPDIVNPASEHVSEGREAIVRYIVAGMSGSISVHHGHGHELEFMSPSEARGVIAMEDRVEWAGPPTIRMHGFGHYHEEYRVEDGAWRIWRSTLTRLRMLNAF